MSVEISGKPEYICTDIAKTETFYILAIDCIFVLKTMCKVSSVWMWRVDGGRSVVD
jgi:hypothetical protein